MICRFCDKPAVQVIVDTLDDDHIPLCEACAAVAAYAQTCTDEAIKTFEYVVLCNHPVTMTIEEFRAYEVAQ